MKNARIAWGADRNTSTLPTTGDGTGDILVDPNKWWEELNERD